MAHKLVGLLPKRKALFVWDLLTALKGGKGSGKRGGSIGGGRGGGSAGDRALREGASVGDIREVADELFEQAIDDRDVAIDLVSDYLSEEDDVSFSREKETS